MVIFAQEEKDSKPMWIRGENGSYPVLFSNNAFNILLKDLVKKVEKHHPYDHEGLIQDVIEYMVAFDEHVEVKWLKS